MSFPLINVLIPINKGINISVESRSLAQNVKNSLNTFEAERLIIEIDRAMGNPEMTAAVIRGLLNSMDTEVQDGDHATFQELKNKVSEILHRID